MKHRQLTQKSPGKEDIAGATVADTQRRATLRKIGAAGLYVPPGVVSLLFTDKQAAASLTTPPPPPLP